MKAYIKEILTQKSMTQQDLADLLGVSRPRCPAGHPRPLGCVCILSVKSGLPRGTAWLLSAAGVSLPNQGFGVKFRDAITLIVNYLSNPLGRAFVECFIG